MFYGTNNQFSHKDVENRNKHIREQLMKYNIRITGYASDGDLRFLKAQKNFIKFGILREFYSFYVAGDYTSDIVGIQDHLHILNKFKNRLFNTTCDLTLGNFGASLGHLVIVLKKFPKKDHQLSCSDLDSADRLNYK